MARASQLSQVTPNHFTSVKQAGKTFHSRTVTLEPGATKQVALGSYFISDPKPHFEVTTTPASRQEQTGVSLEQINIPGSQKYIVFYHLHNFSDEGCEVTITKQN